MSIQSEWLPASKDEPAEFELSYAEIKVQVVRHDATGDIQVRLATTFNTDWMENQFDERLSDAGANDIEQKCENAYPYLKSWRDCIKASEHDADELAALNELINEIEQSIPGLIRA